MKKTTKWSAWLLSIVVLVAVIWAGWSRAPAHKAANDVPPVIAGNPLDTAAEAVALADPITVAPEEEPVSGRPPIDRNDHDILSRMAAFLREGRVDGVLDAIDRGDLPFATMTPDGRRRMTRFLVMVSSPDELKRLVESGRFALQESVIVDVLRRADGPESRIDQTELINKITLLSAAGYSLHATRAYRPDVTAGGLEGNEGVFDRAAMLGLDQVLYYLDARGVRPVSDRYWKGFRTDRNAPTVRALLALGYRPEPDQIRHIQAPGFSKKHPELYRLLRDYL
ncbi:hypothetical protein ACLD0W_05705 [Alloalcanivorax sp. C16-1]|uniref:hypothetical protein n=1 Tax=Alloalcanivorax sp. C16-1 TaxID=3390051 RepID=UPI003970A753